MKDHWNALDVAALAFCGGAFLVRVYDPESLWGRALYCAGKGAIGTKLAFVALFFRFPSDESACVPAKKVKPLLSCPSR
ncbi:unnamed protein product, partial [Ectocarpus sp. 8 AP-2014]